MNRLDRLTAILIHLQTKQVVRAQELANRFGVSLRTVYRDVRSLEAAGVPIGAEAGVGYFLTNYHLPPVMFTNAEASALLFASKLIGKWTDESIQTAFDSALFKIKSVLKRPDQEHLDDLAPNLAIHQPGGQPSANAVLNDIQQAVGRHHVLRLCYQSVATEAETERLVEPVGLYHYGSAWHLIAYCRTRDNYRDFRVDRIRALTATGEQFDWRERLSLADYLNQINTNRAEVRVTVVFPKREVRYLQEQKHNWGFVAEEDLGDHVRMQFDTAQWEAMAHWLLSYASSVSVEQPPQLIARMAALAEDLHQHYVRHGQFV